MRRQLACSFCGRDESQVDKLVAGPHAYICDRCAYESVRIMESTRFDRPRAPKQTFWSRLAALVRSSRAHISFSRLSPRPTRVVLP
jgi:hypothetical protein